MVTPLSNPFSVLDKYATLQGNSHTADWTELPGFAYIERFLSRRDADRLFDHCRKELHWQREVVPMFGKLHLSPRRSCAVSDPQCVYRYRGSHATASRFSDRLLKLRCRLRLTFGIDFNYVLANLYESGRDHVGWHSDDERDLGENPTIASISLGASRRFRIASKHNCEKHELLVSHGGLLLMYGSSQRDFKHMLAKALRVQGERINLSFRHVPACASTTIKH